MRAIDRGALRQGEITTAKAFLHLWRSVDVAITRCPVCERQMRANWAWCPYHADPQQLRGLFDQSGMRGEAITEGSFVRWLVEEQDNPTLADHLQSPYGTIQEERNRLFVHWTEFDVLRQRSDDQ